MQIIDTFSGIGGFSLAGSWMGWRTIQFCEIDPWCHKVLKKHWPNVPIHTDINTLTSEIIKQSPLYDANEQTVVTGGVPCQPASTAGKRRGESDERWLWPQTIEFIGEFKPTFAVLENVAGLVSMENGKTLDRILSDLEDEGYTTEQVIIPACAVGAWHRRDRIWIIAHKQFKGLERYNEHGASINRQNEGIQSGTKGGRPQPERTITHSPNPRTREDNRDRGNISNPSVQRRVEIGKQIGLSQVVHPTSGALNPNWVEWLMGYPVGWTDIGTENPKEYQE